MSFFVFAILGTYFSINFIPESGISTNLSPLSSFLVFVANIHNEQTGYGARAKKILVTRHVTSYNKGMIKSFKDKETGKFWETGKTRRFPPTLQARIILKLQMLNAATRPEDLKTPVSNKIEKLSGNLAGYWSLRVNVQYRIIFEFHEGHAHNVQVVDYH
ncbi:MAG: type II toxin-antitoxin system RelE/ParE family toxin [Bdellovibrionales bacterium]